MARVGASSAKKKRWKAKGAAHRAWIDSGGRARGEPVPGKVPRIFARMDAKKAKSLRAKKKFRKADKHYHKGFN